MHNFNMCCVKLIFQNHILGEPHTTLALLFQVYLLLLTLKVKEIERDVKGH